MRSKTLLTANILSTIYSVALLWIFGGAIIRAGGFSYLKALYQYFSFVFDFLGNSSVSANLSLAIIILLLVHIAFFALGCILGWIAFFARKSGPAKFAATLYLIGTICFPIYFIFGIPITIVGFVGGSKQKKINNADNQVIES